MRKLRPAGPRLRELGLDPRSRAARIGHDRAIQGNLDPLLLCAPRQVVEKRARAVLAEAAGRPGHIFNLGHGIVPETPVDNVKAVIDLVHSIPRAELESRADPR